MQSASEPTPAPSDPASPWLRHARTLVTLLLLGVLCALGVRHAGELDRLAGANPLLLLGMAACVLGVRWLHSEVIRHTLAELGHRISTFEIFGLSMLAAVPNLLLPRSGFGALAVALRARHGVPLSATGALVLPLAVLDLMWVACAGLAVQALAFGFADPRGRWVAAAFGAVLLATGASLSLSAEPRIPFAPARLRSFLERVVRAWLQLRRSRNYVLRTCALLLGISALRCLRLWLAFAAIDVTPHFAGLLVASLLGDVMFLLALTPGGLGLREAAIVYCAGISGVSEAASLAAAVLDRLVMLAVVLVAAQVSAWKLFARK